MTDDFSDINDLDDAIIEDSFSCQCCGAMVTLGGNDSLVIEVPQTGNRIAQLSLCCECAEQVYKEYKAFLFEVGVCEHGEDLRKSCSECQAAINLCKDILAFWHSHEAFGDFATLNRTAVAFAPLADRARAILGG